ncbi:methyl-coenzyme M reductase operon protein D [Methanopyrus kandleri]
MSEEKRERPRMLERKIPEGAKPEVQIFPQRLLSADTTEKLLNELLERVEGIGRIVIHGPGLPKAVPFGPARGKPVKHPERRPIEVHGEKVPMKVQTGQIIVEIEDEDRLDDIVEEIEEICREILPCDFEVQVGRFTRHKPTVTDYLKFGEEGVKKLDKRLLGLVEPRARLADRVSVLKKGED